MNYLQDKSQISDKGRGYYRWKLRKTKVKNYKLFWNYSSRLSRAFITIRADRARAVEEVCTRKLTKN